MVGLLNTARGSALVRKMSKFHILIFIGIILRINNVSYGLTLVHSHKNTDIALHTEIAELVLAKYDLYKPNLIYVTSDGGNDVITLANELKQAFGIQHTIYQHWCMAHSLNRAVVTAVERLKASNSEYASVMSKIRVLLKKFSYSYKLRAEIQKKSVEILGKASGLVGDVPTRWNSSLLCLKRIILLKDIVSALEYSFTKMVKVNNKRKKVEIPVKLDFTADQWKLISEIIQVLELVRSISDIFQNVRILPAETEI